MADPRARVDVVVAERRAHQLLDDVHLFVGAATGSDGTHRVDTVLDLNLLQSSRRVINGLVPRDFSPFIGDRLTHEGGGDAIAMGGVPPGKPTFHTGMALICAAVLVRHHPYQLVATQLCLERAPDPAVGTGGQHGARGHSKIDY